MQLRCCETCGSDTRNRSRVCNRCIGLDSAREHDKPAPEDDFDPENMEFDGYFDRDIRDAIRDALDLE